MKLCPNSELGRSPWRPGAPGDFQEAGSPKETPGGPKGRRRKPQGEAGYRSLRLCLKEAPFLDVPRSGEFGGLRAQRKAGGPAVAQRRPGGSRVCGQGPQLRAQVSGPLRRWWRKRRSSWVQVEGACQLQGFRFRAGFVAAAALRVGLLSSAGSEADTHAGEPSSETCRRSSWGHPRQ